MKLSICAISKNYKDKKALQSVDLDLSPGIYGLLGPNGAGKSTLMNILVDNVTATSGTILFNGQNISTIRKQFQKKIGFMPQQQTIFEDFSGRQFLHYIATLKGMNKKDAIREVEKYATLVNMQQHLDRKVKAYSGGMKQRLLIIQSILNAPDILILDEPTAGLDPKERIRMRNLIAKIALDKIVIFATHVVSDVEFIAKEIIFIKEGKILQQETTQKMIQDAPFYTYEILCDYERFSEIESKHKVVSISKSDENLLVRFISEKEVFEKHCGRVKVTLEDVYLYHFEEK